jgi:hypothetical protein
MAPQLNGSDSYNGLQLLFMLTPTSSAVFLQATHVMTLLRSMQFAVLLDDLVSAFRGLRVLGIDTATLLPRLPRSAIVNLKCRHPVGTEAILQ